MTRHDIRSASAADGSPQGLEARGRPRAETPRTRRGEFRIKAGHAARRLPDTDLESRAVEGCPGRMMAVSMRPKGTPTTMPARAGMVVPVCRSRINDFNACAMT